MFYHLLYPLRRYFIGFNLFGYITVRSASAAITALLVTFYFGPHIVRWLQQRGIGEEIREDGPQTHMQKAGTPTMGGLIVLIAIIVPVLLFAKLDNLFIQLMIGATLFMGFVGFYDDYLKVIKKYPKGLVAKYKLLGQVFWGLVVGLTVTFAPEYSNVPGFGDVHWYSSVPFFKNLMINLSWCYIPIVVLVITFTSNAVNLTDGLDGLAIGLVAIAGLAWAGMSYITGRIDFSGYLNVIFLKGSGELTIYCAALIGGSLGFLWYNSHPASVFMGDTGALALGAALGTLVILQVSFFRWKKRRIFLMAPLHHHFELKGWSEEKVVVRFWIIGIILALLSLGTFKIR